MKRPIDITNAILTSSTYGDPLEKTRGLNPYQRFPERSMWTETEVWTMADGSSVTLRRDCERWGASISTDPWRVMSQFTYQWRSTPYKGQPTKWMTRTEWAPSLDAIRARLVEIRNGDVVEIEVLA